MEVLIHLVIVLIICGVLIYVAELLLPGVPPFRYAIEAIVGIFLLLYLLSLLGVHTGIAFH